MKAQLVIITLLIVAGVAVAFFVPITTLKNVALKTTQTVSHTIERSLDSSPATSVPIPLDRVMSTQQRSIKSFPQAAPPVVINNLDTILNFIQRILGFASTLVGLFLGIKTLKGEQKKRAAARVARGEPEAKPKKTPTKLHSRTKR
jgi:predicted PurR-regulated permease PerM